MRNSENITEFYFLLAAVGTALLHLLGCIEVNKVGTDYFLGNLIACNGSHSVGVNRAVLCDGNIRCTCADIHQCDVDKAHFGRNNYIHCGNRLKGKACNLKVVHIHNRIKTFHNCTGQECGNKVYLCGIALMSFKAHHLVIVKLVCNHGMTHAVEGGTAL